MSEPTPRTVLWWGRHDSTYSRNGVIRGCFRRMGWKVVDFRPAFSGTAVCEARLRRVSVPDLVWVACFRQRDVLAAAKWAHARGVRVVFDPLISAWDKQVLEQRKISPESLASQRLLAKERKEFAAADLVLADTEAHARFFREKLQVPAEKVEVVYVGAEADKFVAAPLPAGARSRARALEVFFYGSMLPLQDPETIVKAAALTVGENVHWTLLGDGSRLPMCRALAKGLPNVSFEPPIPYDALCDRIHKADLLLGIFGTTDKAGRVMPNKFFQAIASGRAVITRTSRVYPDVVADNPSVTFIPPGDPAALAAAVRRFEEDRTALATATDKARALFERTFSESVVEQQLADALARFGFPVSGPPDAEPLLSIIIPVYNVEPYLARCLDSVLSQSLPGMEILCIDDGSTDGSSQILAAYAARDSRLRVLTQANAGLSAARNTGLDVCRGTYVMFVDSDDALPNGAVSRMVSVLIRSGADMCVAERLEVNADWDAFAAAVDVEVPEGGTRMLAGRAALERLVRGRRTRSSAWNKCFRRSTIGAVRFRHGVFFEDWPFVMQVMQSAKYVVFQDASCYVYWKGGASIIRSVFDDRKVDSYASGIRDVVMAYRHVPESLPLAMRRAAIAAGMMINRTARSGPKPLKCKVKATCRALRQEGCLRYRDLPLKSLGRLLLFPNGKEGK